MPHTAYKMSPDPLPRLQKRFETKPGVDQELSELQVSVKVEGYYPVDIAKTQEQVQRRRRVITRHRAPGVLRGLKR